VQLKTRVVTVYRYDGLSRYWHVRLSYRAHLLIRGKKKKKQNSPALPHATSFSLTAYSISVQRWKCPRQRLRISIFRQKNKIKSAVWEYFVTYIRKTIVMLSLKMDIQFARYVDEEWLQKE